MDFSLSLSSAQKAISRVMDCSPSKSSFDGSVPLQIESFEGAVSFSVIGDSSIVLYTLKESIVSDGTAVVDMHSFHSALMALNTINENGDGVEVVRFFKSRQTFKLISKAKYSGRESTQTRSLSLLDHPFKNIEVPDDKEFGVIPFEPFVDSIRSVSFSVPVGVDKATSGGVVFECRDKVLKTVTTNGVSLTEFKSSIPELQSGYSANLNGEFVMKLGKVFYKLGSKKENPIDVCVFVDSNVFWIKYKGLVLASPISNTVFPDYSPLLKGKDNKFVLSSSIFSDNIRNIMFSSIKDDDFRITLKFMEGSLSIVSSTCENENIPMEAGEHNLHIDFNAYLIDGAVRNLSSEYFVFSYKDRYSPVLLEPYDSDRRVLTIVAPLK